MSRCLYNSSFEKFINADDNSIFGALCDNYHGDALTTTREAWKEEISIIKGFISDYADKNGQVIFEYDIPRLGKRIDVVLLFKGIVFCVEFKVGESKILEADIDQVLDCALDLKNFHKFSQDNLIVPILVATNYRNSSTDIRMSVYDDRVVNPLVTGEAGDIIEAKAKNSPIHVEVGKFIQIIHRYRDNMLAKIKNPVENGVLEIDTEKAVKLAESGYGEVEHVAIFDEAQRSWAHKRLADYLKRGGTYGNILKVPNFPMSEAAFLIWSLDQREGWATIICLVGGGQEINTGEAGISEWINALNEKFPHWNVYISSKLTEAEYAEGKVNV